VDLVRRGICQSGHHVVEREAVRGEGSKEHAAQRRQHLEERRPLERLAAAERDGLHAVRGRVAREPDEIARVPLARAVGVRAVVAKRATFAATPRRLDADAFDHRK
jgi:hypothetical protein